VRKFFIVLPLLLTSCAYFNKIAGKDCRTTGCADGKTCNVSTGLCETPPWKCDLPMPSCTEVGQTCSTDASPCWHNPTQNPQHCEEAPKCSTPPPPPPPPPPVAECDLDTPSFTVVGVKFNTHIQGTGYTTTPIGHFGKEYCAKAGWTDGRVYCAVAPDGYPKKVLNACNRQFLGAQCPIWKELKCTGVGNQCPFSFTPYRSDILHDMNVNGECPADQPPDQPEEEGFWMRVSGKGTFQVCTGEVDGTQVCTPFGPVDE
jgi:hypothetical protein